MNDVLRRGWLLALIAGLVMLPACSSDSSGGGDPSEMETYADAPMSGEPAMDRPSSSGMAESQSQPPVPWVAEAGQPSQPAMPPGMQDEAAAQFRRMQEERSLTEQRADLLVDTYINSARQYLQNGEFDRAEKAILQALEVRDTDSQALELWRELRTLQGQPVETMEAIGADLVNRRQVVRQAQVARVRDHFLKANQAFREGDYEAAYKDIEQADLLMKFDTYRTDFGSLGREVPEMMKIAELKRDQARRSAEDAAFRDAYESGRRSQEAERLKEEEKVRQTLIRGVESFVRGDFDNAQFLAKSVLATDPGNRDARDLLENSERGRNRAWQAAFGAKRNEHYKNWLEDARNKQVPNTAILQWPSREHWESIDVLRRPKGTIAEALDDSEAVRAIRAKLENESISFNFGEEGTTLSEAIAFVRTTKAINIVIDNDVLTEKGEEPVTITLVDHNLGQALKTLLNQYELSYTFRDSVLLVTTAGKALGKPYPYVYDVRDLTVSLPNFKAPNLALRPVSAGADAAAKAVFGDEEETPPETTIDALLDLIRNNVARESWDTLEGASLQQTTAGMVVANTTPAIHEEITAFLADLRRFTKLTVHVEARFISLQKASLSEVGFDFRGLGGQNPGTLALLEDVSNGAPYNASAGLDNGGAGLPGAAALSPSAGLFYNDNSDGDIRGRSENILDRAVGGLLTNRGGAAVAFQILDDLQIGGLFTAVEKRLDTSIVNAPRLTIFNNQRANLTLVNQVSYVKDYDVEVAQTAFIADPLIDIIQDGLTLDVKPTVSHDRTSVRLEVQPTLATLVRPIRTFETNLAGISTAVVFELPVINFSQAATTINVPDNGYVVIGGLKHISSVDRRSEVPILGNIPFLSFLFSKKGRSDEIRDLIIVLHVKIIDLSEIEENLGG